MKLSKGTCKNKVNPPKPSSIKIKSMLNEEQI
jgi:hypothetical protein